MVHTTLYSVYSHEHCLLVLGIMISNIPNPNIAVNGTQWYSLDQHVSLPTPIAQKADVCIDERASFYY